VLESEVAGETLREAGVESVGEQDGDVTRGEVGQAGQDGAGVGDVVVEVEDVAQLQLGAQADVNSHPRRRRHPQWLRPTARPGKLVRCGMHGSKVGGASSHLGMFLTAVAPWVDVEFNAAEWRRRAGRGRGRAGTATCAIRPAR
jgi:hypothetical protein